MGYFIVHCQVAIAAHGSLFLTLFMGGVMGSLTHCTGMCGPFVMAQVGGSTDKKGGLFQRIKGAALLPYHGGRIITYTVLGVAAAALAGTLMGTPLQKGTAFLFLITAGLIFVLSAIPVLKQWVPAFPATAHLAQFAQNMGQILGKYAAPFIAAPTISGRFFMGLLLGLLPCGLVMAAVMAVAATGDPVAAAFGMIFFGLGTVPSLFLVGIGTRLAQGRWPAEIQLLANGMMALNGVSLMVLAGTIVV